LCFNKKILGTYIGDKSVKGLEDYGTVFQKNIEKLKIMQAQFGILYTIIASPS